MDRLTKVTKLRTLQYMTSAHVLDSARYCGQTPQTYATTQDRERHPAQVIAYMGSLALPPE